MKHLRILMVVLIPFTAALHGFAQHQTQTTTPVQFSGDLPYRLELSEYQFGNASLPTLHSYASGEYDGKWVLIAGRTNGLHGFDRNSVNNFPTQFQNRDVWVIDPLTRESWHKTLLGDPNFTEYDINALTPTNNQFYQSGDTLYMTGGYGVQSTNPDNSENFGTFDTLSAIDLSGIVDWVINNNGNASDHIRIIRGDVFKVTGGAMYEIDGRSHLVFGQDFDGVYRPNVNGTYTNRVRSFDVVDDGTNLSTLNATPAGSLSLPDSHYRRRDLNVYPTLTDNGGQLEEGLTVLSGVFTNSFGAWTVPVEIDADGVPTQVDNGSDPFNANGELDDDPQVFKQGFNGYHSAKLGLFSEFSSEMHEILFGGISLQTYDVASDQVITDNALPFINDITSVVVDENGSYEQHWLGEFPEVLDLEGKRLRFGANAEFFLAEGIETYANGVIKLDELNQPTTIGYIFGGLTANGPHTRNVPDVISAASNRVFAVDYYPIPEPAAITLLIVSGWLFHTTRILLVSRVAIAPCKSHGTGEG